MKIISMFNHKGGVAKTTTAFHLAWMLSLRGKRVMLVDCDPQCNLTGVFIGEMEQGEYPFESKDPHNPLNIRDAIKPAFESRPYIISPAKIVESKDQPGLFLLPGHVGISEYESQLAVAHELSHTLSALQNIPGAINHAIKITGAANNIDYAIVDMSPSLGALNQNLFMTSDAFIIPMAPDLFSSMALRSLSRSIPKWAEWGRKAAANNILKVADYPFPDVIPKYLGASVQNFRKRSRGEEESQPTVAFQRWFTELNMALTNDLLPALKSSKMLLDDQDYQNAGAPLSEFLMEIGSLDGLIATAQDLAKPVFAIDEEISSLHRGKVAITYRAKIEDVRKGFERGADKVIGLMEKV